MRKAIATGLLAAVMGTGSAAAMLVRQADVPAMVKASDLIVVGRAADVQIDAKSASETLVVWVDRVIAGSGPGRLSVRLSLPQPGSSLGTVAPEQYGLFFLHATGENGVYTAAAVSSPALPAAPGRARGAAPSDALGGVAHELARVLTASAADLVGLKDAAAAQHLYWEAANALEAIPGTVTGPELRAVASADATPARLWAVAVLLNADEAASSAADYLKSVEADLIKPPPGAGLAVARLAVSIQAKVNAPKAVPVLARLLQSSEMVVRRGAANALARIATPDVIAPLAKIALNDQERDIRYYAVRGLSQATGAPIPTLPSFYEKEAEMLGRWRSWARINVR